MSFLSPIVCWLIEDPTHLRLTKPSYLAEVVQVEDEMNDLVKSSFGQGKCYRYLDVPSPLLEVSGSYYEMGLQYGVLLYDEIMRTIEGFLEIAQIKAKEMKIPLGFLIAGALQQTQRLTEHVEKRFIEEAQGVAEGCGLPFEVVWMASLSYDIHEAWGCTGVLMRTSDWGVIHGRNNDSGAFFGERGELSVVCTHRTPGYGTVTHVNTPLLMGVETGYNEAGLCFSEETLCIKSDKRNPLGVPLLYTVRQILEECTTLDTVVERLEAKTPIAGYGCVISSRNEKKALVFEYTPHGCAKIPFEDSLLWNFNHLYTASLREDQQTARVNLGIPNVDRELEAQSFPKRPDYNIHDCIKFLRLQDQSYGYCEAWSGNKFPICNVEGQQAIIFDPKGDGMYLATGFSYAARRVVHHVYQDFSKQPSIAAVALPIPAVVEASAHASLALGSEEFRLQKCIEVAKKFPEDANAQFRVARFCFMADKFWDTFIEYAERAYSVEFTQSTAALGMSMGGSGIVPSVPADYWFFLGLAKFKQGIFSAAKNIWESMDPTELHDDDQAYRLGLLSRAYEELGNDNIANRYDKELDQFLAARGATDFKQERIEKIGRV